MGCCITTGTFGPVAKKKINFDDLAERDSDIDILEKCEFPYAKGRLKEIDWKTIIKEGKPWKDPDWTHGRHCLFIDHRAPKRKNAENKLKWTRDFHWKRASEFYAE